MRVDDGDPDFDSLSTTIQTDIEISDPEKRTMPPTVVHHQHTLIQLIVIQLTTWPKYD